MQFIEKHKPLIFAVTSVILTLSSVTLTFFGTRKATLELVDKEKVDKSKKEQAKVYAKHLWPAGLTTVAACSAPVFGAVVSENKIDKMSKAASTMAASAAVAASKLTKEEKKEIIEENMDKKILRAYQDNHEDFEVLVYDPYSKPFGRPGIGRYFTSTLKQLENAELLLNKRLHSNEVVSLNDYYDLIDDEILRTNEGEELGWSMDIIDEIYSGWIHVDLEEIRLDDGPDVFYLSFHEPPDALYGFTR